MDLVVKIEEPERKDDIKLICCCGTPHWLPNDKCEKNVELHTLSQINDNQSSIKKSYACKKCGEQFLHKIFLRKHVLVHARNAIQSKILQNKENIEKQFKCDSCSKSFKCKEEMYMHFEEHLYKRPFQCNFCKKFFGIKKNLNFHYKTHFRIIKINKSKLLKDNPQLSIVNRKKKCFKKTSVICLVSKESSNQHRNWHKKDQSHKCEFCLKFFKTKQSLVRHRSIHTGEKPFKCCTCGKSFSLKSYLRGHETVHTGEKPFQCCLCKKRFTRKCHLQSHEKTHTGEKPFQCGICEKFFRLKVTLKHHLFTHTGEKPLKCNLCEKGFTKKHLLIYHITDIHGYISKNENCECQVCTNSTKIKLEEPSQLKDISISNFSSNPQSCIRCQICSELFYQKCSFAKHLMLHKKELFKYKCSICDKSFLRKCDLKKHGKTYSKDSFVCNKRIYLKKC